MIFRLEAINRQGFEIILNTVSRKPQRRFDLGPCIVDLQEVRIFLNDWLNKCQGPLRVLGICLDKHHGQIIQR